MESILTSIKLLLGITEEYTHYDNQIIMHINSVFQILRRLGVGPAEGFRIEDDSATWNDFIPDENYEDLKTYVYLKVQLIFNPPDSSAHMESIKQLINEFEFQLNLRADSNE